jgi:hypothetical protein
MKSTRAEVQKRVEEVFKLRLGGAEFADIVQYAAAPEQDWGVSERQLWNYFHAADQLVKRIFTVSCPIRVSFMAVPVRAMANTNQG